MILLGKSNFLGPLETSWDFLALPRQRLAVKKKKKKKKN